jgi:hypothetical protein
MLSVSGERTFHAAILPKGVGQVHTVLGTAFRSADNLLDFTAMALSTPIDFRVKSTGMGHANTTLINQLPLCTRKVLKQAMHIRVLGLMCVTRHYDGLWVDSWVDSFNSDSWSLEICSCSNQWFDSLKSEWSYNSVLRSDFERRQALLELDVLAAMELNFACEELLAIYRIQFPVMRQYEAETYYDQTGRIIFTPSKGLSGVGLPRKARAADLRNNIHYGIQSDTRTESNIALGWEDVRNMPSGVVTKTFMDDTLPDGPHERTIEYVAPFFCPDREEDYRVAWAFFESRLASDRAC